MIPEPGRTLTDLAMRIATHITPHTTSNFAQADCGLITGLLLAMAQDVERAVDNRMQDLAQIRELFQHAPDQAPGQTQRQQFMHKQPSSFQLRDVNALHDEGMALLIDLHGWAELHDHDLNRRIWAFLHDHADRNSFDIPGP